MKTKFLEYSNEDKTVFDEPVVLNSGLQGLASNVVLKETLKAGDSKTVVVGSGTFLVNLQWSGNNAAGSRTYIYYSYNNSIGSNLLADLVNFYAGDNVHNLTFGDNRITLDVTNTYSSSGNTFTLSVLKIA